MNCLDVQLKELPKMFLNFLIISSSIDRFERAENIVKAQEIVVNLVGASLDPPVDQMDDCMQARVKCDLQTVANTFSKFQFHFVCLRKELEAPTTI